MQYLPSYSRQVEILDDRIGGIPNLHYGKMKRICMLKPAQIAKEYGLTEYTTKNGKKFWFKDNNSRVLGVAHADTVKAFRHFRPVKFAEDTKIFCQTLDDRLGMYILLEYLAQAKIKIDILITNDEEKMASTGLYFGAPKTYNWMFMFDRAGTGAVTYKYGDEQLRYKLGKHNFDTSMGTYSCITEMEHLGCKGINFGTGYHDNHEEYAYASRKQLYTQLRKFLGFFKEFEDVRMPHEEALTKFTAKYWRQYDKQKEDLKGQYSVIATKEEIAAVETARERREAVETMGKHLETCDCEICLTGIDCKDFPELQGPKIKPSEDILPLGHGKSIYYVDDHGKITGMERERSIYLLYESIQILAGVDAATKNILRNTFAMRKIWDVAIASPYQLMRSGYLQAPDIDAIDLSLQDLGFGFAWNVAGLRHPDDEELRLTYGYKRREKIMKKEQKKEPTPKTKHTPKMGLFVAGVPIRSATAEIRKTITMFPTKVFHLPKMIAKAKELTNAGYIIQMFTKCNECHTDFEWDYTKQDLAPERCAKCATIDESQLSLFTLVPSTDHVPEEGAGVLGLIQLRKDFYDDSEFTFIGKEDGRSGIDKYGWVDPIRKFEEIGFVVA